MAANLRCSDLKRRGQPGYFARINVATICKTAYRRISCYTEFEETRV